MRRRATTPFNVEAAVSPAYNAARTLSGPALGGPGFPEPLTTIPALYGTLKAVMVATEILLRRKGNILDSAVCVRDLVRITEAYDERYVLQGAAGGTIEAWSSFTPTFGNSNADFVLGDGQIGGRKRRVGDSLEVVATLVRGSTTNLGSGIFSFGPLPDSLASDILKTPLNGTLSTDYGICTYQTAGGPPDAFVASVTKPLPASDLWGVRASAGWLSEASHVWAATNRITLRLTVPIQGWGAT